MKHLVFGLVLVAACSSGATTEIGAAGSVGAGGSSDIATSGSGVGGSGGGDGGSGACTFIDSTPIVGTDCKADADCDTGSICNPGACDVNTSTCWVHALANGSPCEKNGVCIDRACCAKGD